MKLKKNPNQTAKDILAVIGFNNVEHYTHCMTRLRISLKQDAVIDDVQLKNIVNVLGVIKNKNEYQIILGPGFVNSVTIEFAKLVKIKSDDPINENLDNANNDELLSKMTVTKSKFRKKTKGIVLDFFNKISLIFTPFIYGFVAAGIFQSIGSIILMGMDNAPNHIATSFINFFTLSLSILTQILCVIIGYNTAKAFGGTPILGAILGGMYTPAFGSIIGNLFQPDVVGSNAGIFLGIPISDVNENYFTVGIFRDGKASGLTGSIFGAIFAAYIATLLERQFNKFIPDGAKIFLIPLMVIFSMLIIQFLLLAPITGYISLGLGWFFKQVTMNKWITPWLGAILAGVWLWAVVFGVHQAATPIYLLLIAQTGVNALFPIVAMAGASQVGTALALYVKAKKGSTIRQQIAASIVPGIFGIGEPLIYGITLPRIRTFITACIGAAIGGLFIGLLPLFGATIGTNALGPSGILATFLISSNQVAVWLAMLLYLLGLVITYGAGFVVTFFFGTKNVDLK